LVGPAAQVHEQVAGLLNGPRPVGVGGDAEDMYVPAADLHDEENVQALQGESAVHMEEVARQHGRRLRPEESAPGGAVTADRRGRYPQPVKDPADRGGADPVSEAAQLASTRLSP
jgi:hypothetical protein